jgi:LacI family transcriptional regulator
MGKKVKNKDLAARLGLSCTLVSLVLNNKADQHGIRKDTQERVLALARQMGYFDLSGSTGESFPAEEKPGVIGMIVPAIHDPFIYEITPYLQKAFSSIGIGFSIVTKDPDDQRYTRMISSFRKFFSGLILVGEAADDYTIRYLRNADYPFVLLEQSNPKLKLNSVCTDHFAGTALVASHLSKLGYRKCLALMSEGSRSYDNTLVQELRSALSKKDNSSDLQVAVVKVPLQGEDFDFTQIEKYMRPPFSIQVIVPLHADIVYPVMSALQKKKVRVPQDIAIVSLEDGPGFDLLHSPVTTLKKPLSGLALKIANIIWTEVKNSGKGKYKRQINLSPELLVRRSCGSL